MSHKGTLQVSTQLLLDALRLPKGGRIIGLQHNPFIDSADIIIEHPDLPEVAEGDTPPTYWPRFKQTTRGVRFVSWGNE